ncbi:autotransporter domain-containing protein [Sinorhizobium meliloti]|nr:autotransporter domain-containing protein [Sinorhizobium meliloti]MDX0161783.1 autotransporter domain-containing protein [Sinorhizobium meliloti]MDX0311970.1 autotransporter domain-containing protein [Sinorhizobium meliloti]
MAPASLPAPFLFANSHSFSGELWGLQAGQDLIGALHDDGSQDRVGLYDAYTGTSGSNGGNTLGRLQFEVGSIDLHASSIGAYWTHIGEDGWYVDSIGMYSWLDGGLSSDRGIGADTSGNSVAFSVEAG